MSSSNSCFLTCIQISQEASRGVWCSHFFNNFPQFVVIHTVKFFGIVNKAEIDVFLELSCFFNDPADADNLISGSSAFSKSSLNIWKFMVHVLLKLNVSLILIKEYYILFYIEFFLSCHFSIFFLKCKHDSMIHICCVWALNCLTCSFYNLMSKPLPTSSFVLSLINFRLQLGNLFQFFYWNVLFSSNRLEF